MTAGYNDLAHMQYASGVTPLDWALCITKLAIDTHREVEIGRAAEPGTFQIYALPLTNEALARRIVGQLLDAGWTPPEVTK